MSKERAAGERNSRRDEIEEHLHLIGVWDGSPKRRLALAIQCDVHGITVADIERVAANLAAKHGKDMVGLLVHLLQSPQEFISNSRDLRRGEELRRKRRAPNAEKPYPGSALFKAPAAPTEDRQRMILVAHAVLHSDRQPAAVAAQVLGCSPEEAEALAADGCRGLCPMAKRSKS